MKSSLNAFDNFLKLHQRSQLDTTISTHTRIPNKAYNIYGGSYHIPDDKINDFWNYYYDKIFENGNREYMTERQYTDVPSPLLVDLDFKYHFSVDTRQHNDAVIHNIVEWYVDMMSQYVELKTNDLSFNIYITHKQKINQIPEKELSKDGIHILFGINVDFTIKQIVRTKAIEALSIICQDLPLINSMEDVIDLTISRGTTNWQVYGSRKPGNDPYLLTHHIHVSYSPDEDKFIYSYLDINQFDLKHNIQELSARNLNRPEFNINPDKMEEYNLFKQKNNKINKNKNNTQHDNNNQDPESNDICGKHNIKLVPYHQINNQNTLKEQIDLILNNLPLDEYYIKETHDYAQILPDTFYRAGGSHENNTKLAFALKNTDNRLFLSWVMVRSKASDFLYSDIPNLKKRWDNSFNICSKDNLTRRSIMYWAKQENPSGYQRILEQTSEYFINQSLIDGSDWDIAMVLYQLYKDKYICANTEHKIWYQFINHRWVKDQGNSLRVVLSSEIYKLYEKIYKIQGNEFKKIKDSYEQNTANKSTSDITKLELLEIKQKMENAKDKYILISNIISKLKNAPSKNHIITEAAALFYDHNFIIKADSNPMLLCFTNGVWDFSTFTFRIGFPQDYITKCTNIQYIPTEELDPDIVRQVQTFMSQLFISPGLNTYMWEHLASCLVGGNKHQTFNMYIGSGSNGKSKLTDLMSKCFGEYKGSVPISLVTDKRPAIGGTASEIINLKGVRYAVMQEPTKSCSQLNEGVMKEITGSDPITARGLYKDSETFTPQLTLVVCSNILFEINSTDNGTWRRIRICKFGSQFVDPEDIADTIANNHGNSTGIFIRDYELDRKIVDWAPTFMSTLVSIYLRTKGSVTDCEDVLSESKKYRDSEDILSNYITDNIEIIPANEIDPTNPGIGIKAIFAHFKNWFQESGINKKLSVGQKELQACLEKKWSKNKKNQWVNIRFKHDNDINEFEA